MILKSLGNITKEDIENLVKEEVHEVRTIEYKSKLPGRTDKEKREFCADVSSFANAAGGDIIYGMEEKEGIPINSIGLSENLDEEINRLEQIARSGLEPRIPGLQFQPIKGFRNGPVLIVRIPKSWTAPHMVKINDNYRCYTRTSAGKHPMDVTEIRSAFLLSEALPEKIKRFRDDRLSKIIADETPVPVNNEDKVVVHILPIVSFSSSLSLEMQTLTKLREKFNPIGGGGDFRINLDGFLTLNPTGKGHISYGYCQTFRGGQIESVHGGFIITRDGERVIIGASLEKLLINACLQYFEALNKMEVPSPLVVLISMIAVSEACIATNEPFSHLRRVSIDRNILLLPDILVEEYESINDFDAVAKTLRPAFDALWNASGYERSLSYDEEGNWHSK